MNEKQKVRPVPEVKFSFAPLQLSMDGKQTSFCLRK